MVILATLGDLGTSPFPPGLLFWHFHGFHPTPLIAHLPNVKFSRREAELDPSAASP
jgi:hypothetical protein